MASCPKCQNEVDCDFGMSHCNKCEHIFFVSYENDKSSTSNLAVTSTSDSFSKSPLPSPSQTIPEITPTTSASSQQFSALDKVSSQSLSHSSSSSKTLSHISSQIQSDNEMPFNNCNESLTEDITALSDQILFYDILISGIDSHELINAVQEIIDDPRFNLPTEELIQSIQSGILQIHQVSPVKACVLIQKLQELPLKVLWRYYAEN